jgi:hypothetical protein
VRSLGLGDRWVSGLQTDPVIAPEASSERAFADVVRLAGDIGERLAGTAGEQAGIAYLAEQFRTAGLDPHIEQIPVPIWAEQRVVLRVAGRDIPAVSPCFGGITHPAGITAEVVAVGDPMTSADLAGVDLVGKIALIDGRDVQVDYPDYIQTDLLLANDVAGVVFAAGERQQGGLPQAYYNFKRALHQPTPPSVIVSAEDARWLAAHSGPATIAVNADIRWSTSANVWAELPGSDLGQEVIVVSAHHDAVRGSPGASDNAGGCAIVSELARSFGGAFRPRRTICFVHFGAHEVGLFGSETWLRHYLPDVARIAAVINFDGLGLIGGKDTASVLGGPGWVEMTCEVLGRTLLPLAMRFEAAGGVGVDSVNFAALGRNAINFGNGGAPRAHTPADNLGPLGPSGLGPALHLGAALLAAAANRDDVDLFAPPPPDQVRETQAYCARWGWGING